jgi:DNA-binding PadR family transcriptional regulator
MSERRSNLGEFELLVLLAALRLGSDEAYAVSIVDEIENRTARTVQRAAVYVAIQRLEKKGLVSTKLGEPLPERGGKARRMVTVEGPGRSAAQQTRRALQSMWHGLGPELASAGNAGADS